MSPRTTPTILTPRLKKTRDKAARAALEAHDFSPMVVTDLLGAWDPVGDRWRTVVWAEPEDGGRTFRCQFNVIFEPETASVRESYRGDWI